MQIDDYQDKTNETAIFPSEVPEDVPAEVLYTAMGLVGESGECAEKVKKAVREDDVSYLEDLEAELGDVLWYWAQLIEQLDKHEIIDADASTVAEANLDKLLNRRERGQLTGEGDNR